MFSWVRTLVKIPIKAWRTKTNPGRTWKGQNRCCKSEWRIRKGTKIRRKFTKHNSTRNSSNWAFECSNTGRVLSFQVSKFRWNYTSEHHIKTYIKRADSVTCRNEELQKDLINAQLESTRLRKDCTQLVQEIEKLRQEQTEDRKRAGENERLTAQLGRQIAEQKSALEKEQIENLIVSLFLSWIFLDFLLSIRILRKLFMGIWVKL